MGWMEGWWWWGGGDKDCQTPCKRTKWGRWIMDGMGRDRCHRADPTKTHSITDSTSCLVTQHSHRTAAGLAAGQVTNRRPTWPPQYAPIAPTYQHPKACVHAACHGGCAACILCGRCAPTRDRPDLTRLLGTSSPRPRTGYTILLTTLSYPVRGMVGLDWD